MKVCVRCIAAAASARARAPPWRSVVSPVGEDAVRSKESVGARDVL